MQMDIELLHFLIPVVDTTLFLEMITLFLISRIAISLFSFLSNPVSRALANLNLLILRFLNNSFCLCFFLQTAKCW